MSIVPLFSSFKPLSGPWIGVAKQQQRHLFLSNMGHNYQRVCITGSMNYVLSRSCGVKYICPRTKGSHIL